MNHPFANALMVSALISFSLAVLAFNRRPKLGATSLSVIMTALGLWAVFYAFRWLTNDTAWQYFWLQMTYFGVVLAPPAMLVFSFQFAQRDEYFTSKKISLLAIEPIITLLLLWTDAYHGWFFGGHRNPNAIISGGIWFWFNAIYTFALIILAIFILFNFMKNAPEIARRQALIINLGFIFPLVGCLIGVFGLSPFKDLDLTPFIFIISGVFVVYGFRFYGLLDIAPIAYSRLVETTSNGIIILDSQKHIVYINPAAQSIFPEINNSIGQDARTIFSPYPEILKILDCKYAETTTVHLQQNGVVHYYSIDFYPIQNPPKPSIGWFAIFHDISTYKKTEEAFLASENKIRSLFHSITDVVLILDKDGRYLEIAPTNPENLARDPLQLMGKTVYDIFPQPDADLIINTIHQALTAGRMVQVDYAMTINGKEIWFSGNVSPLSEDAVIWIARDITNRKQMEKSLLESETRLRMAQKIAHVGNWEFTPSTGEFWASDEYLRIMGVNPSEEIKSLDQLERYITTNRKMEWSDKLKDSLSNLQEFDGDIEILYDGEIEPHIMHVVTTILPDVEGKPNKVSGVIQDITAQKQIEHALEKRMMALTQPLEATDNIELDDLFNIDDLQSMQDAFARAMEVASIITRIDGTPITKPSNFCRFCNDIIRKNPVGGKDCIKNDSDLCQSSSLHTQILPCPSVGLLHAGAPIRIGGKHIANWLIGQLRSEDIDEEMMLNYVHSLGIDETEALNAFREIPTLSKDRFMDISQALYTFSTYLSNSAYQNIQQARFISERRRAEEALQISENKLRSLFRAMTDVIIIYDSEGRYQEIAPTSSQRYFRSPDELKNRSISEIFPPDIASLFMNTIYQTLATKEMTRLDYSLPIGGHEYWFSANVSPLTEDSVIWVARDITDRKKVEDTLHYQSMHDILTGLYNRQYYEAEIERLQRSRLFPISILVMDVDGLKWVNDHRGHSAGDELLQRVAGLLKSSFRPEDMVARMGGDEFVVVLPLTAEPAARQAVERLELILAKHNELFPSDQSLSLSIGFATGGNNVLLTEVFKQADQAMYLKKKKKKEQSSRESASG